MNSDDEMLETYPELREPPKALWAVLTLYEAAQEIEEEILGGKDGA